MEHERLEPLLLAHLLELRKRNLRPRSIRERKYAVLRAARALGHPVSEADADEVARWQDDLTERIGRNGRSMTPTAIKNEVVHVGQYLRWAHRAGHRADDAGIHLVLPRNTNQLMPRPLPEADLLAAYLAADPVMRCWITLAADCGLRCMEIAGLRREDVVDGDNPRLRITGKGGKERAVNLSEETLADLTAACDMDRRSGPLFVRLDGRPGPPSPVRVSERINAYLHGRGIRLTAHSMRHRFGTRLYELTRDVLLVADLMGHASTDTTRIYVHLNTDGAAAAIRQM